MINSLLYRSTEYKKTIQGCICITMIQKNGTVLSFYYQDSEKRYGYDRFWTQNTLKLAKKMATFFVPKDAQCSETNAKLIFKFLQYLVFEIWLILCLKFLVNWGLIATKLCLGGSAPLNPPLFVVGIIPYNLHQGLRPQASDAFGIESPQPNGYLVSLFGISEFV